jgi:ABC-type branched-subunit amino acid transport system substrate-binding protein
MHAMTICALLGVLALAACGGDEPPGQQAPQTARAVSTSVCSPLTYGAQGKPRFVVALVAPLQGALSDHGIQNAQAVKLVMQQRGWRAGEHGVAIQVCDEASADSFSDAAKCRRNARAFAGNSSVVAVVGPTTSGCAAAMVPLLNGAAGGALASVGIGNTYLGLTREGPGVERGDPERMHRSGVRSYFRTVPADDAQAATAVLLARDAGARRPFALHDGTTFGRGLAAAFVQAARGTGFTEAVGSAPWDPQAGGYAALAATLRRRGADAVYLAGFADNNGPRLIRDLRAALGREALLVGPDGFNQPSALVAGAGADADGMLITLAAAPVRALPEQGRRWAAQFRRRWGAPPCCYAVHAGQVMQLVLDAIAASDGTRAGVLDNLRGANVQNGLVGDFRFDGFGDTTLTAVATYVIRGGRARYVRTRDVPRALLTRR